MIVASTGRVWKKVPQCSYGSFAPWNFPRARAHANFLICLPRVWPISSWSRWLTTTLTMKTMQLRKGRERGFLPPFKDMSQNCTHDSLTSRWPGPSHMGDVGRFPTYKGFGKYHLYLCDRVPGFCLCEREQTWLLKDNQEPWWEGWVETVGKQKLLPWEWKRVFVWGWGVSPGDEKSGWSFSCDLTSTSLVLCVFRPASNPM